MTIAKYSAKYVYWDTQKQVVLPPSDIEIHRYNGRLKLPKHIVRFDSHHEFRVYIELCRMYGSKCISRQYKVKTIEPCTCYPTGKYWKVDFAVSLPGSMFFYDYLIEAKGVITSEFINNLVLIEQTGFEAFESLYIVFPHIVPANNKVIKALQNNGWEQRLFTFKQFRQLDGLL